MSEKEIGRRLVAKGKELFKAPKQVGNFTDNPNANSLLNDLDHTPHAFVIACVMNRQIKAERAWFIPWYLVQELGTFEFLELRKLDLDTIHEMMKPLHRFYKEMSVNLVSALELIDTRYGKIASRIWKGRLPSATVVYRFLEFRGVGPKIATMAVNILARRFMVHFSDYYSIDISPDVHVRRVFKRLGLIRAGANTEELIYRARALNPKFPGILDLPAWKIGRQWCRPNRPQCSECYMHGVCPSSEAFHRD